MSVMRTLREIAQSSANEPLGNLVRSTNAAEVIYGVRAPTVGASPEEPLIWVMAAASTPERFSLKILSQPAPSSFSN